MKNKIIIVKGNACLSEHITLAEFERINADYAVIITALRKPQFVPSEISLPHGLFYGEVSNLLKHWRTIEQDHLLISEYASIAIDRDRGDVKVVEGTSLETPWFFETVKALHKQFGQQIIELDVIHDTPNIKLRMNGKIYYHKEIVEMFKPESFLG
jgi:hypothetical protein